MSVNTLRHIIHTQEPGIDGTGITTIEKAQLIADIMDHQAKMSSLKSVVYDARDLVSASDGSVDVTAQLQAGINNLPAGAVLYAPAEAVFNLSDTIVANKSISIRGEGEFRFTAGMANKSGFQLDADYSSIEGIRITNPNELASPSGASSRAVHIRANRVVIASTRIDGWETGIYQSAAGEYWGLIIDGNQITNINGVGSEGKGDGIMVCGAGAIISGNLVEAKVGTDARCGIVIEGLPEYKTANHTSNATGIDESAFVVSGNIVRGPFRRSIHAETVFNYTISNNICIGARWWGMMIWSCDMGIIADNHIVWTENGTSPGEGTTYRTPLYCQKSSRARISGNTIRIANGSIWNTGMFLSGAGANSLYTVEGNTLLNQSTGTGTALHGENLNSDITIVRGNIFRGLFGKAVYLWLEGDAIISDNDAVLGPGAIHFHVFGYRRAFVEGNYIHTASSSVGVRLENGTFGLAARNKIAGPTTGINGSGSSAVYAPDNTFFSTSTPTTGVTSTTSYGP